MPPENAIKGDGAGSPGKSAVHEIPSVHHQLIFVNTPVLDYDVSSTFESIPTWFSGLYHQQYNLTRVYQIGKKMEIQSPGLEFVLLASIKTRQSELLRFVCEQSFGRHDVQS